MEQMKRKHALFMILLAAFIAVAAAVAQHFAFQPLNRCVTTEGLRAAAEETGYILVKSDDQYYEIQGTAEFSDLFEFDAWRQQKEEPAGEPVLILRFAEAWIVEFFSDGAVTAHNGYADRGTNPDAYYSIPPDVADALISYIEISGIQHEYGDGAIGSTTFQK